MSGPYTPHQWLNDTTTAPYGPINGTRLNELEAAAEVGANRVVDVFKNWGTSAAAINQGLISIRDAGGGTGFLRPGYVINVDEPIVLPNLVGIESSSHASCRLKAATNLNAPVIQNYVSADQVEANGKLTSVRRLIIDGNSANQSVVTTAHGIYYDHNPRVGRATGDFGGDKGVWDSFHIVHEVIIWDVARDGIKSEQTMQSSVYKRVWVYYADRWGIRPSFDTVVEDCVVGHSGLAGFYSEFDQVQYVACKAFYAGEITASGGFGFELRGPCHGTVLTNCCAQDCQDVGFSLAASTEGYTLVGCVADSNGVRAAGTLPGFDLWGAVKNTLRECRSTDGLRRNGVTNQANALRIRNSSVGNVVEIQHGARNGAVAGRAITSDSTVTGNDVAINADRGTQAVAFAASITPDPYKGRTVLVGTLTGNLTVNAPTAGGISGYQGHVGSRLRFVLTQDGTGGRTVTFPANFKTSVSFTTAPFTTAAKISAVEFEYDGTNWVQVAASVGM